MALGDLRVVDHRHHGVEAPTVEVEDLAHVGTSRSRASAGDRERPWPSRRSSRMGCARRRSVIGRSWNRLCRWTARRSAAFAVRAVQVRPARHVPMPAPGPRDRAKPRCYVRLKPVSQCGKRGWSFAGVSEASRGRRPSGFADRGCTAACRRAPAASRTDCVSSEARAEI